MKRLLIIAIIAIIGSFVAPAQATYIVQQFGDNLSNWASSQNILYAKSMKQLCSTKPAFRIGDNIMASLAYQNGLNQSEDYLWGNYMAFMQEEVNKGITISLSNIEQVPESMIPSNYKGRKDLEFVSCNIRVSGASNFNEKDLFVIVKGKIAKIQEYQVTVDKKGHRKLHVDLSDLDIDEDTEGIGLSYNYSKAFPLGASITYNKWKFMISMDFGVNFDNDIYTTQKVDFTNIVDYRIITGEYNLKYFLTATPAFYMKYFAVGWGFGYASLSGHEVTKGSSLTLKPDGSVIHTVSSSNTSNSDKLKFMMRPTVKGFIPCSNNFFISLSVNYDWILDYKEKSGISFGAGIHILFD